MKPIITFALLFFAAITSWAQMTFPGKANQHTILGGEDGKNFGANFSADFPSRHEAISKTVEFLCAFDLVQNAEEALEALKEFDDTKSQLTVPVSFRFGWHGTAPVMGAVAPLAPVILNADLHFDFYDNGKIQVVIRNFSNKAFTDYVTASKSRLKEGRKEEDILTPEEVERYKGYIQAPTMQAGLGKAITTFLVFANAGLGKTQEIQQSLGEFLSHIDEQIEIAEKLAGGGYYIFGTPEEALKKYRELIEKDDLNYSPSLIDNFEKEIAEERLVYVYELFWNNEIKQEFDYVFLAISAFFNGTITAISENGVETWVLDGDKLLPTDTKLKKKLVKEGKDYFSYYGN